MLNECDVVLTGIGIIAPNGIGLADFWQSLLENRSGIKEITAFDTSDFPVKFAGEIRNFDLRDHLKSPVKPGRMARHTQLAMAAARMAMLDAGISTEGLGTTPLVIGVSTGGVDIMEQSKEVMMRKGLSHVSPHTVHACHPHAAAAEISGMSGLSTRTITIASACPAGLDAIAYSIQLIKSGKADTVITGGADSPLNPLTAVSLFNAGMIPAFNGESPDKISRPFDRKRRGGIMAEGAGMFVIERADCAAARGITPYLSLRGYGTCTDGDLPQPAMGLESSMREALHNSGMSATEIDYICAHGPGDPLLDKIETQMIKKVFGSYAYTIPVTSIKGATGNPLAAAGPMELATCALIMKHGIIPSTTNYQFEDPDCDLDYVPREPRRALVNTALLNLHGLGGGNSSLIVSRVT